MTKMMWFISLVVIVLIAFAALSLKTLFNEKTELWLPNENYFVDPNQSHKRIKFPDISDLQIPSNAKYISLVVPAYNEEERIPIMLDETLAYLKEREKQDPSFTWEIIVVDDGSKDPTTDIVLKYAEKETVDRIRVLTLMKNRGKGGAVRRGVFCARGKYILMVDADGATKISDLTKVEEKLKKVEKNGFGIGIGSRAHLASEAVAKRTPLRNFLMYGFHLLVNILGVQSVQDTQCGFKLFTRESSKILFNNLHIERWAFDIELLLVAQQLNMPMVEVAVNWHEIPGSKLNPFAASFQMGMDILKIRAGYLFGFWKIEN